jgi:hypothetical protein
VHFSCQLRFIWYNTYKAAVLPSFYLLENAGRKFGCSSGGSYGKIAAGTESQPYDDDLNGSPAALACGGGQS